MFEINRAFDRIMMEIEAELGTTLCLLTPVQKREALRMAYERGVFTLRHSHEDMADEIGVTRTTIYNWLHELGWEKDSRS